MWQVLGSGQEVHLLLDLLEFADALGAKACHFLHDRRSHPTQSLLSHSLAPFQGEALCVYLPGRISTYSATYE